MSWLEITYLLCGADKYFIDEYPWVAAGAEMPAWDLPEVERADANVSRFCRRDASAKFFYYGIHFGLRDVGFDVGDLGPVGAVI